MTEENFVLHVGDSERSFRCDNQVGDAVDPRLHKCGCNVFKKDTRGRYVCNSCGARYVGEKS